MKETTGGKECAQISIHKIEVLIKVYKCGGNADGGMQHQQRKMSIATVYRHVKNTLAGQANYIIKQNYVLTMKCLRN